MFPLGFTTTGCNNKPGSWETSVLQVKVVGQDEARCALLAFGCFPGALARYPRGQAAGQGQYGAHLLLGYGSALHTPHAGSGHMLAPLASPSSSQERYIKPSLPETTHKGV